MKTIYLLLISLGLMTACAPSAPATPVSTPTVPAATPAATPSAAATSPASIATAVPATLAAPTATPQPASAGTQTIALKPVVVGGLVRPTDLTQAGDARLFVLEQPGRIRIIENGQLLDRPFLDITGKVQNAGNEQGLLGLAFHPDYATNGQFFVDYTRQPDGATVIERYTVSADDANLADAASAHVILTIDQPEANHNGGQLQFGPDGFLYIGMGDGGGAGDRHGSIGNGQNLQSLLGKLLRLDVTNQATYAIPADNPFGDEIWAYGLRNPWRFSFDRATGDLYIADVGQNQYEEVDFQPAASPGGENYGWRIMEGRHCFNPPSGCDQTGLVLPVAEYSHADGCSITGGYVYRGTQYPQLNGQYFFADYCIGTIWSLQRDAAGAWQMEKRLSPDIRISSFGEDASGELYVIDHGGAVYQLTAE